MSIIDEFLKSAGGKWCNVSNTAEGDRLNIREVYLDADTFDKPYIVAVGVHNPSSEERKARLAVQNVKRIAEVLGNENGWIGNTIRCIAHQDYPGLGQKGLLWTGVKTVVQHQMN